MSEYLSIGKVSKLKHVSIKSLRYYDKIGVFCPCYINHETNYRYYSADQLSMLDVITTCIELGIPLKSLNQYVEHGIFNVDRLLGDCRQMADMKIRAIYSSLDQLKNFSKNALSSFSVMPLERRMILTSPLTDYNNISQKILRLLMLAQLIGVDAAYPSGILHTYSQKDGVQHYLYITVTDCKSCVDKRIITIPSGKYHCIKTEAHTTSDPTALFTSDIEKFSSSRRNEFSIIETHLIQSQDTPSEYRYELQLLVDE